MARETKAQREAREAAEYQAAWEKFRDEAITDLREALEQQSKLDALDEANKKLTETIDRRNERTMRLGLDEQAKQEPVYWEVRNGGCSHAIYSTKEKAEEVCFDMQKSHDLSGSLASFNIRPLYAVPQPVSQEPIGVISAEVVDGCVKWLNGWVPREGSKLYTVPVRTKDLTNDEITVIPKFHSNGGYLAFARAVIAADREKQNS